MKAELPNFWTYCENTTAANALAFNLGRVTVYYSYKTPVGYQVAGEEPVVRRNEWGPTTGKHLNAIDGGEKKTRVDSVLFESLLSLALASIVS